MPQLNQPKGNRKHKKRPIVGRVHQAKKYHLETSIYPSFQAFSTIQHLFGAQHFPHFRTGLYIESISIQETKSILFFSGDVTAEVADGDQITLDESTVLLNGRGQLSWTDHERCFIGMGVGVGLGWMCLRYVEVC